MDSEPNSASAGREEPPSGPKAEEDSNDQEIQMSEDADNAPSTSGAEDNTTFKSDEAGNNASTSGSSNQQDSSHEHISPTSEASEVASSAADDHEQPGTSASQPPQRRKALSYEMEEYVHPSHKSKHDLRQSFSWNNMLSEPGFLAAPVECFYHAPLSDAWDYLSIGMKVEVENFDLVYPPGSVKPCYWFATVLRFNGYMALLRYDGFGQDSSKDFWINICSDKVHRVGFSFTKRKPLVPPLTIRDRYHEMKDLIMKRMVGSLTLPAKFYNRIHRDLKTCFRVGMKLEVVDKMRICQVRVATIKEMTGRRLCVQYDEVDHDDNMFWCHEESPLIHPVGWAKRVGHQIAASQEYFTRCALEEFNENDTTPDMFPEYRHAPGNFSVGMKIEAVDPLNLASICVATVMKVLRFGYIMIRIDGYETDETGSDWFCYHASSPLIFAPGYCEKNNIRLKPPAGWEDRFTWYDYLKETNSNAAPNSLFLPREDVKHGFQVGMKLEAADQMDPRLICVSTVSRVVGRLLKIHFDGWEDDYDQWMDCENVDIYPVGWAELVGHRLEGPRQAAPPQKKGKTKHGGKKGKKRSSAGSASSSYQHSTNGPTATTSGAPSPASRKKKASASVSSVTAPSPTGSNASPSTTMTSPPVSREATPFSQTPPPPVLEPQTSVPVISTPTPPAAVPTTASAQSPILPVTPAPAPAPIKVIPRLVDSTGQASLQRGRDVNLDPASWSVQDVAHFLQINECSTLVDAFSEQGVDGNRFLSLAKEDIMRLVNNKIGPCLKVENLLGLLKARMNPAQARYLATLRKEH